MNFLLASILKSCFRRLPDHHDPLNCANDPYWQQVRILMHFDDGFIDEKNNSVTLIGSPQTVTNPALFSGSAGSFDGTNQAFQITGSAVEIGTQDFTLEFWYYPNNNTYQTLIDCRPPGGNGQYLYLASNNQTLYLYYNSAAMVSGTQVISADQWHHVALVRKGNRLYAFVDGKADFSISFTGTFIGNSLTVGRNSWAGTYLNGYLDDFRLTVGVARYHPQETALLLHFDEELGAFVEDNGHAVTVQLGTPQLYKDEYHNAVSFNGSSALHVASDGLNIGLDDFEMEMDCRPLNLTNTQGIFGNYGWWYGARGGFLVYMATNGQIQITFATPEGQSTVPSCSVNRTSTIGVWTHILFRRTNGTLKIYVDGEETASYSIPNVNIYAPTYGLGFLIGCYFADGNYHGGFNGQVANIKVRMISAQRDLLLTHFTPNTYLNTVGNTVSATGNIVCSDEQTKVGSTSLKFTGNDHQLVVNQVSPMLHETPFTFEAWVFPTDHYAGLLSTLSGDAGYYGLWFNTHSNGTLYIGTPYTTIWNTETILSLNVWTHVALTVDGNLFKIYVNGNLIGTHTNTSGYQWNGRGVIIGNLFPDHHSWYRGFNGFMSAINLTRSIKYTENFTPSVELPATDANTIVMLAGHGFPGGPIAEETGKLITLHNNFTPSNSVYQFGPYSGEFTAGSHLICPGNFGLSEDFTIEFWVRRKSLQNNWAGLLDNRTNYNNGYVVYFHPDNKLMIAGLNDTLLFQYNTVFAINVWYHVCITRKSGTIHWFVDGDKKGSFANTSNFTNTANRLIIGNTWNNYSFDGFLDELRISNFCRYEDSFTVANVPYMLAEPEIVSTPKIDFYVNVTENDLIYGTLSKTGNIGISASQSKFGGFSAYFDGSSYLDITPTNAALFTIDGDFTIEGWVYPTQKTLNTIFELGVYNNGILVRLNTTNSGDVYVNGTGVFTIHSQIPLNQWTFLTLQRKNTTCYLILNQEIVHTWQCAGTINTTGAPIRIGEARYTTGHQFLGYIDEFRLVNGRALYPTHTELNKIIDMSFEDWSYAPGKYATVQGDVLPLLSAENSLDGSTNVKFVAASNNGVIINDNNLILIDDFLIDFWAFPINPGQYHTLFEWGHYTNGILLFYGHPAHADFWYNNIQSSGLNLALHVNNNAWNHFIVRRISGKLEIIINDQSVWTANYHLSLNTNNSPVYIGGARHYAPASHKFNGHIDNFKAYNVETLTTITTLPPTQAPTTVDIANNLPPTNRLPSCRTIELG